MQVAAAAGAQAALCKRVAAFFGGHDFLLCPATMVAPFDADVRRATRPWLLSSWGAASALGLAGLCAGKPVAKPNVASPARANQSDIFAVNGNFFT